jgi:exosome complex component CSL4
VGDEVIEMSVKNQKKNEDGGRALPGDALAVAEEFLPGQNVYDADGTLRALQTGTVVRDFAQRELDVRPVSLVKTPSVGDVVTGQIETAQTSTANLKIYYLNGVPTLGGFVGIIFMREDRGGGGRGFRRTTQLKLGDIVRAKVVSTMNGIIHLSIADPHAGVIAALCSNCGRPLRSSDGRARCDNCGNVEDRKFADDFDREVMQP